MADTDWVKMASFGLAAGLGVLNVIQYRQKVRRTFKYEIRVEYGKPPNDNARRLRVDLLNKGVELQRIEVRIDWRWSDYRQDKPTSFALVPSDPEIAKTFKPDAPCSFYLVNRDPQELIWPMQPGATDIRLVIASGHAVVKEVPVTKWHRKWIQWAEPTELLPDSPLSGLQRMGEPDDWYNASRMLGPDVPQKIRPNARFKPERTIFDPVWGEHVPYREGFAPTDDTPVSDTGPM